VTTTPHYELEFLRLLLSDIMAVRAGGLWFWFVLLALATSGVAMNLPKRLFQPVVSLFATLKSSLNEIASRRF
jgi:hypothetical protein